MIRFKITMDNKIAIYSGIIGLIYLLLFIYLTIYVKQDIHHLFGIDYSVYYAASQMVLDGDINSIYNIEKHHIAVENVLTRIVPFELPWLYPPTFFLFILPLAFMSYKVSLFFWIFLTLIFCIYSIYILIGKKRQVTFLILGFPAILMNLRWGQNGFLNTALLALGFYFMQVSSKKAGIIFGLLTYKPQIICFPLLILLLCKKWTTLLWTGLTFLIIFLVSVLFFGFEVWFQFLLNVGGKSAEIVNQIFEKILDIQPTVYALFKILGVKDISLILIVIFMAIISIITCTWVCGKSSNFRLKSSSIIIGIFLTMPYLAQYDLMILGIPLVLLFWDFKENGSNYLEKIILFFLWLIPLVNKKIVNLTNIQICPLILIIVMVMICLRISRENRTFK